MRTGIVTYYNNVPRREPRRNPAIFEPRSICEQRISYMRVYSGRVTHLECYRLKDSMTLAER